MYFNTTSATGYQNLTHPDDMCSVGGVDNHYENLNVLCCHSVVGLLQVRGVSTNVAFNQLHIKHYGTRRPHLCAPSPWLLLCCSQTHSATPCPSPSSGVSWVPERSPPPPHRRLQAAGRAPRGTVCEQGQGNNGRVKIRNPLTSQHLPVHVQLTCTARHPSRKAHRDTPRQTHG